MTSPCCGSRSKTSLMNTCIRSRGFRGLTPDGRIVATTAATEQGPKDTPVSCAALQASAAFALIGIQTQDECFYR